MRAVGHRPHHHVHGLGHQADEVPEGVVRRGRLRIAAVGLHLHAVDEIGELDRVLDEEHRDVVADEVPVAGVGVELDGKAAHVARRVDRAGAAGHGREAHEHRAAVALLLEDRGLASARESPSCTSKTPCAPEPRACTMRSGMRSWSKWKIFSRRTKSSSSVGPRAPARSEFWLSEIGCPKLVVSVSASARALSSRARDWCVSPPAPERTRSVGLPDPGRTASRALSCAGDCDLAFFSVVTTRTPDVLEIVGNRVRH